jgi:hypothetical protein
MGYYLGRLYLKDSVEGELEDDSLPYGVKVKYLFTDIDVSASLSNIQAI